MLKIFHINVQDIVVRTEYYVHITYSPNLAFSNELEPASCFKFMLELKRNIFAKVSDHFSTVFACKINCKQRQMQKNWKSN